MTKDSDFDSILLLSFGGPEGPDQVMPFLENVTRGRNVPRERLEEVAHHYDRFGGISPINGQNRALLEKLREELQARGISLPVYFGNRNWHPFLADTFLEMSRAGLKKSVVFATSAFSSYSGCRQYKEDLTKAQGEVQGAPEVLKIRPFFDHPGFVAAVEARIRETLEGKDWVWNESARVLFTAHSIPMSMAQTSAYQAQLLAISEMVFQKLVGPTNEGSRFELVFQSRSGPPQIPWLEPDICDRLKELSQEGVKRVLLCPLGFVSDHMEIVWDLDNEAKEVAGELGIDLIRSQTVGTHPLFVSAVADLIEEVLSAKTKPRLTQLSQVEGFCGENCCPAPVARRPTA